MLSYQIGITLSLLAFVGLVLRNLRDYSVPEAPKVHGAGLVSVLLPVRNEAANIVDCLNAICAQTYPHLEVVVLDDCSEDNTAALICQQSALDPRIRLVQGRPIPAGWAGKVWACSQLGEYARGEWLLFMDADTRAHPELIARTIAAADSTKSDMLSGFPNQKTGSFWEAMALPMIHFLLLTFLPIRQVWESKSPAFAAACGQFELFRRGAYEQIGGHGAVPTTFHDGLQLGRRIKRANLKLTLVDVSPFISCRMYAGGREVWNGFTRNAYEGIGSFGALLGLSFLEMALFFCPFVFFGVGLANGASWTWLCGVQLLLIYAVRILLARRFGAWATVPLHPLGLLTLFAIQWGSWWRTMFGKPVAWKGRDYAAK